MNLWPFSQSDKHNRATPKQNRFQWLRTDQRYTYLVELLTKNQQDGTENETSVEKQQFELNLDRDLPIAVITSGLAIIGSFGFPLIRLLCLPGLLYGLWPISKAAYDAIIHRGKRNTDKGDMDILYAFSQVVVLVQGYFVTAGLGVLWFILSQKLMLIAKERFRHNLHSIFEDLPTKVYILVDGMEVERVLDTLVEGDLIVLRAGEVVPVDGVIAHGFATIDQQALTGESQPAEKERGDPVYAATVVLSGMIYVQLQMAGYDTMMAQINQIMEDSTAFKDTKQTRAEMITHRSVLPLLAFSGLTTPFIGIQGALAVLEAHPYRRIIISTPLSTINYLNLASENSILVKDGRTFELLQDVDTIVFDKTGTLTLDQPIVTAVHTFADHTEDAVLGYAAAAEARQSHPIAKAILQQASTKQVHIPMVDNASYQVGYGLTVHLQESNTDGTQNNRQQVIRVGSSRFIELEEIALSAAVQTAIETAKNAGNTIVLVAIDVHVVGAIELAPAIRSEAVEVVRWLQARGKEMYIVSGDYAQPTRRLAETLGIERYFAETLPEDKGKLMEQLQHAGKRVCFVGDGINDTIAMKKSHVSVSLRGATTAATDTAQVVLMDANLRQLIALFELANQQTKNNNTTISTIMSGVLAGIGGALFFGTGVLFSDSMNQIFFPLSLGVAMWPAIRKKTK
ncbi:MAG: heavy metal translocating P-type ATPase [Chloroflexota bacterium]